MATPTVYVICDQNCKWEGMTKEQILTAITQAVNNGTIGDIDTGFIQTIKTINGNPLRFFVGTQYEYNALRDSEKKNLFAIITDDTIKENLLAAIESLTTGLSELTDGLSNGNFVVSKASRSLIAENDVHGNSIRETYFRNISTLKNNSNSNGVSIPTGVFLVNVQVKTPFTDYHTNGGVNASTIVRYDGKEVTSMLDTIIGVRDIGMYRVNVKPIQGFTGGTLTVQEAFVWNDENKTYSYKDITDFYSLSIECIKIANI